MSLVRYRTNDYSVPTEYGHRQVLIKGYVNEVVICAGNEEIARHRRSYGREELIFHPLHYLGGTPCPAHQRLPSSPWQKYDPPLRGLSPFFAPS